MYEAIEKEKICSPTKHIFLLKTTTTAKGKPPSNEKLTKNKIKVDG